MSGWWSRGRLGETAESPEADQSGFIMGSQLSSRHRLEAQAMSFEYLR